MAKRNRDRTSGGAISGSSVTASRSKGLQRINDALNEARRHDAIRRDAIRSSYDPVRDFKATPYEQVRLPSLIRAEREARYSPAKAAKRAPSLAALKVQKAVLPEFRQPSKLTTRPRPAPKSVAVKTKAVTPWSPRTQQEKRTSGFDLSKPSPAKLGEVRRSSVKTPLPTAAKHNRADDAAKSHVKDVHSVRDMPRCKERPQNNKSKGGGSSAFIPWCDRKR